MEKIVDLLFIKKINFFVAFHQQKKVCSALDILHSTHYANSELKGHKTHFKSKKAL